MVDALEGKGIKAERLIGAVAIMWGYVTHVRRKEGTSVNAGQNGWLVGSKCISTWLNMME
jgi:hypothetical protein